MIAGIYVYDGGRYHEVVADRVRYHTDWRLDDLMAFLRSILPITDVIFCNGAPPGELGDYSRGCFRHRRPMTASIDRPCCPAAAKEIYTWWDEIKAIQKRIIL